MAKRNGIRRSLENVKRRVKIKKKKWLIVISLELCDNLKRTTK